MEDTIRYKKHIVLLIMLLLCIVSTQNVSAAAGKIYTCKITASYQHPITGKIEDSGGSQAKATGQGMVEGSVFSKGLMEITQNGDVYLTVKMSLIDQTSKHSFSVQKRGATGWNQVSVLQTDSGKDNNGKTADLRMKLPAKDSIIRCSMYVNPMGRNVIFYFYPSSMTEGNSVGMKAKIVTEQEETQNTESTSTNIETTTQTTTEATNQTSTKTSATEDETLNQAQGLSLSTAPKTTSKKKTTTKERSTAEWILILTVSMTISGLILLFVAAMIVYYYRKNWDHFGADKDEYDEIYDEE